jgi:hypothetical protein
MKLLGRGRTALRYRDRSDFVEVICTARIAFSKRSWPYVVATALPWLLCSGQRCVSRLAALGAHPRSRSGYYRFLSDGKWRLEALFRSLFGLVVRTFALRAVTVVLDDTLCPKWGKGIFGTDSFFDHARRPRPGYVWGHNWVVLAAVVPMGTAAWVALPFWIALYRSRRSCRKGEFRTRHEIAVEALRRVREWFSGPILLLADGAYYNGSLVTPALDLGIEVTSRIRSDARLREPSPPRQRKGKRGRKPTRGHWMPRLNALSRSDARFARRAVAIYGKTVTLLLREVVGYWPPLRRVVKVVIAKDPKRKHKVAYLSTTDLSRDAVAVVESFGRRWSIEQLFSVCKLQLGLDSAEVRKERSVTRHAALCIALATWTQVWAHRRLPRLRAASFATKLAALREETVMEAVFASGPRTQGSRRIARALGSVFSTATAAA